jgi:serine protease Do
MTSDPLFVQRTNYPNLMQVTRTRVIDSFFSSMMQGNITPRDVDEMDQVETPLERAEQLRVADWSQGPATLARFRPIIAPIRSSVVVVLHDGVAIALGTVVGADGWVITKATELPASPTCRLPDGRILSARVVGVEPASDLALLKVAADGLSPVRWAVTLDPSVGTVVAAVGAQDDPLAIGILSVQRRNLAGISRPTYTLPLRLPAGRPEIYTATQSGASPPKNAFSIDLVRGLPWSAGVRIGDVLRCLAGRSIHDEPQLIDAVKGFRSGDVVDLELERHGKSVKLRLPLRPKTGYDQNYRADGFPTVVECAVPLFSYECGGPVVDLNGQAIGITIACLPDCGVMVIPCDCVLQPLPDLKAGTYADNWLPNKSAHK